MSPSKYVEDDRWSNLGSWGRRLIVNLIGTLKLGIFKGNRQEFQSLRDLQKGIEMYL